MGVEMATGGGFGGMGNGKVDLPSKGSSYIRRFMGNVSGVRPMGVCNSGWETIFISHFMCMGILHACISVYYVHAVPKEFKSGYQIPCI